MAPVKVIAIGLGAFLSACGSPQKQDDRTHPVTATREPLAMDEPRRASRTSGDASKERQIALPALSEEMLARWHAAQKPPGPVEPSNVDLNISAAEMRAFITERWAPWLERRVDRVRQSERELVELGQRAIDPAERERALWYAYYLWERLERAALGDDASRENRHRYRLWAMKQRMWRLIADAPRAAQLRDQCLAVAGPPERSEYGQRCMVAKQRAEQTDSQRAQKQAQEQLREAVRRRESRRKQRTVPSRGRRLLTSEQPVPCRFKGSLKGRFTWRSGGKEVFRTWRPVEVARLDVPQKPAEPMQVTLTWPVVGDFELEAKSADVFEFRRKLEVVPGHVWLAPRAVVRAHTKDARVVTVIKSLPANVEPAQAEAQAPCSALSLNQTGWRDLTPSPSRRAGRQVMLPGPVQLFSQPEAQHVAVLDGSYIGALTVLDARRDWRLVAAKGRLSLRGWVRSEVLTTPDEPLEMATLGALTSTKKNGPTAYELAAQLPIRLQPQASAPVIGRLSADQRIIIWSQRNEFIGIKVQEAVPSNDTGEFFVESSGLKRAAPGAL